jgi:hypothetical protein
VRFALSLVSLFPSIFCVRMTRLILLLSIVAPQHSWVLAQAGQFGGQRVLEESGTSRDGAPGEESALASPSVFEHLRKQAD